MSLRTIAIAAALAFSAPVFAAEAPLTLSVTGDVKVSAGADFSAANSGRVVDAGNRIMLAEGARAVITYGAGCRVVLDQPGVYTVPATCVAGAQYNGVDWVAVGGLAAGVAVIAAGLDNMEKVPGPPVSR